MDVVQGKGGNFRFDGWSSLLGEEEQSLNVSVKKSFLLFTLIGLSLAAIFNSLIGLV